jgi:prepilin-type N-terminal cleavage/methylation domain-containing protein
MKSISENGRRAFTLVEMLVVIAIMGLLAALLMPVLSRAKIKARNITCVSQLRQLGVAVRLQAEDNNGVLPVAEPIPTMPAATNNPRPRICDVLGPYVGKTSRDTNTSVPVFRCPADREGFYETEGSSYWWNNIRQMVFTGGGRGGGGGGGPLGKQKIDDPAIALTPMLSDFDDFHPRAPQTGRNSVYADGHVDKFAVPRPVFQ